MPEVEILIGGRSFQVACQEGEESFLQSAASLLDKEANALAEALGRVPEERMLLMAGLMLADRTAGLEDELRLCEKRLAEQVRKSKLAKGSTPVHPPQPENIFVPTIPDEVFSALSEIADRAEGLATQVEDAASS